MNRLLLLALLVGAALLWLPEDAYAHGGQYRVPGGGLDPGLREPTDPTPPPPPPAPTPPTTPPSTPPTNPTPAPTTQPPVTPPSTPGTPGTAPTNRGRPASLSYDNWIFWYAYNNAEIENLKESIYAAADTNSPLAQMGGGVGNQGSETHDIRNKIESHIIPLFLWAMDPQNAKHDDIESASYIGLAKVAKDPQHIELITKGLNKKNTKIIKESAALALGLLRRQRGEDQFSATDLNKVRDTLFDTYQDEKRQVRVRCFAAFGLALLGDQPAGEEGASSSGTGAVEITRRIFGLLEEDYGNPELTVSALIAVGLQPESSVTEEQRTVLRECVLKSKLYKRTVKTIIPAHAAAALGKIGTSNDITLLRRALTSRRSDRYLQSSAAIGLGQLANRINSRERVDLTKSLLSSLKKIKVQQAVNFSLISLAYIVNADVEGARTDVLSDTKVGDFLLKAASAGKPLEKPYAALALGLICRQIGENPDLDVYGEFRHKALAVLRDGVSTKKLAPRDQSAFVVSLGMARDAKSITLLRGIVGDRKSNREKAGYAALALGLIPARGNTEVLESIKATLKRTTDEELKIRCATSLGLLRDNGAVKMLLEELDAAKVQSTKGQLGLSIAKIGDGQAVIPMVEIVQDKGGKYLSRAIMTAALGVIGDLEWIPSLNRISKDINYRALNDSLNEVLSIL